MEKLEFLPASNNEEHLIRHSDGNSSVIGSKAVKSTTKDDISNILARNRQGLSGRNQ